MTFMATLNGSFEGRLQSQILHRLTEAAPEPRVYSFSQRGHLEICCGEDFEAVYQLKLPRLSDPRARSTSSINSSLPPTTVFRFVPQHHTTQSIQTFHDTNLDHLYRLVQSKQFTMCKLYKITYSCGCTKPRVAPCAESPNAIGRCSEGLKEKEDTYDGPCDEHA
ncbi:hypothetical protein F5Y13DRAFT_183916 [Hypoxylon sp. FL1857]|nr:hypothetical protein F5Y13DRAFT_183916 [Hypoxylon sp. FL1857]